MRNRGQDRRLAGAGCTGVAVNALGLTPMLATSAFALGYAVGWAAMKAMADGRFRRRRAATGRSWADWLLGREPSERGPF